MPFKCPWNVGEFERRRDLALSLVEACFRIQREACAAAGRYIPLVVENVKGAQKWIGKARGHFGSFYFWGDIDSVGSQIIAGRLKFGEGLKAPKRGGQKNGGGSWFAIANNTTSGHGQNPDGRKLPAHINESIRNGKSPARWTNPAEHYFGPKPDGVKVPGMTGWDGYGKPGYKPQGFNVLAAQRYRADNQEDGVKRMSGLRGFSHPSGKGGRDLGGPNDPRRFSSRSGSRKAASAQIAKIPFPLAQHIARVFKPEAAEQAK